MTTARRRHARVAAQPSTAFTSVALAILAFFSSASAELPDPTPAPGPTVAASHSLFSYEEKTLTGPDKWGSLDPDWAICRDGKEQSPIDISKVEAKQDMGPLEHTYNAGACIMQNRGHDFILKWKDGNGKLTVEKKDYVLQQVHWHVPSEHTVNGTRFDMEMHMVHQDSSGARAVISVLFSTKQAGHPSKTLTSMGPYFKRLAGKDNEDEDVKEPVDPSHWVDESSGYYRYEGSLTTPPCTEGVIWTIMSKVKHVTEEQIKLLDGVSEKPEENDRPAQKINDRVVRYYESESAKSGMEKKT
ncbi:hypothetical protein QYE76_005650 [Lolium multiflorum]|uniref:Carbonic anhydrase n=1 Tax=Lolium multiflorum TaxID=4521 RepID=A0AAD8W0Y3_LOLMU|nr:hypothetical protein QYE76_005650 [Lolium multiflorum]